MKSVTLSYLLSSSSILSPYATLNTFHTLWKRRWKDSVSTGRDTLKVPRSHLGLSQEKLIFRGSVIRGSVIKLIARTEIDPPPTV